MKGKYFLFGFISIAIFFFIWLYIPATYPKVETDIDLKFKDPVDIRELPGIWLERLKNNSSEFGIRDTLCRLQENELFEVLSDESIRKTFLINLYNAYIISELKNFKGDYESLVDRTAFFSGSNLCLAGNKLSANDIEHDLLRNGRIWWSFGWFKKISKNKVERKLSTHLDPRIHFALNCGAASCPPLKIYDQENIDLQLEESTINFLRNNSHLDTTVNSLEIIELLNWFIKDFDGQSGLILFMKDRNLIPRNSNPQIKFTGYDWSLKPGVWAD